MTTFAIMKTRIADELVRVKLHECGGAQDHER